MSTTLEVSESFFAIAVSFITLIYGAFCNLVPFVQFTYREKHPSRSVNFSKVAG